MPAVEQHHARPVLRRIVEIVVFDRTAHVLSPRARSIVVLDDLYRVPWIAQCPQAGYVAADENVAVNEQRPPAEVLQTRDEIPAGDELVRAALVR